MKEGWEYKKLGDCIDKIPKQKQVKSKDYKSSGLYPIVSQEKELISGYWDDISYLFKHKKPIIIFGDHTKEVKYVDFDFVIGADGTQILSPKDDINTKYFYYALKATPLRSLGYARHYKLLKEKTFAIAPLSEQQRIVKRLDAAFAHIDGLKVNAEKSLNEAKALFQASLKEMLEPKEGWEEKTIGKILNLRRGHDLTHSQMNGSNYPVAGSNGQIGTHNYCTPISPCITVGRSGSVGAVNIYKECWAHNTTLYIDDFKGNYPRYLYYLLKSIDLGRLNSGSAVPTLNRNFIHPLKVRYIKDGVTQKSIVSRLDSLSENVKKLEENQRKVIAECDALKQAILRQVFE